MDVLNNLRDFLNVKNVSVISGDPSAPSRINPDAATDLLSHFHQQWEELHDGNEINAQCANEAAEMIENISARMCAQNEHIQTINHIFTTLPSLQATIQTCNNQIQRLCQTFERVENDLIHFENLIEQKELERKKNNHRYQLALYEEKKISNLEFVRGELSKKHAHTVVDLEQKKKQEMQERQQVFQDAFKNDLETYKALGAIPKIQIRGQSSALLEEIQLDIDNKELIDFLEET